MNPAALSSSTRRPLGGFTLTELLIVMGVIGVLSTLTLVAVRVIARDARLSSATNTVMAALDNARALAMKRNKPVLVAFYPEVEGRRSRVEIITAAWAGDGAVADIDNMPDGAAYRPGDIVTCYNGKTVEILNTDAEGRMILADALSWAAEEKPDYLIDYATLTGACVVALGQTGAGLFSHHDGLADRLLQSAGEADERLWRLPLWPEFTKQMKGRHADLRNSGSRWGGASTAAAFLANFVDGADRWAHIDIAGPAYIGSSQPSRKGATGYGVGLTTHWLRSL